jgi:hypothetical protein
MAVETLDGTIEPAAPRRRKGKYAFFDTLQFRDRSGIAQSLSKICAAGPVADAVTKGASGRFYLSSGGGQTGIHGVRLDDGTNAYAHYNNMEWVVLIGAIAGLAWLVIGAAGGQMMITPVIIGLVLAGFYVFLRGVRVAGKRQFEADAARA